MELLDKTQTKDKIASILRQEIISGHLANGDELTQEQIAELLGVSRMPVREAFQTLILEGFLLRLPNRHVAVVGLTPKTLYENMQLTAVIEIEVITSIIQSNHMSNLQFYSNEEAFHQQFLTLCKNVYLTQVFKQLLQGYPHYYWRKVTKKHDASNLHKALFCAIMQQDKQLITENTRQYYQLMAEVLLDHRKQNE